MIPKLTNQEACKLAIKHRLFVSGWMMNHQLHLGARDSGHVMLAAVYMEADVPIAVTVVTRYNDIQVFVRKSARRRGIGSKLIEYARKTLKESQANRLDAGIGLISGSREFWQANNIPIY